MHQLTPVRSDSSSLKSLIEERISAYAKENGVEVGKVPPFKISQGIPCPKGVTSQGLIEQVKAVREEMVQRAALENERGQSFSESTRPTTVKDHKPLPKSSPLLLIGRTDPKVERESPPPRKGPSTVAPTTGKSMKFLEALTAMRSRLDGVVPKSTALEPLGLRLDDVSHPDTRTGGRVLTNFPDVEPVGQGRVEVHPFRWKALGIDPTGKGEEGTTLVLRTRHWKDKIEGEGAAFQLSLVGGNTIPLEISSVKPDQHTGVVIVNVSDRELSKLIGAPVGNNLNFCVEAAFTDKERPRGRHTQKCEFQIPTERVTKVERQRVGWGEHETVEINLPRKDGGVVSELRKALPDIQSMTTMMETEVEFVLPSSYDMLSARRNLFALAMNPDVVKEALGEGYLIYPADKYIEKSLKGITPEEYEKLPMSERAKHWRFGPDGLPKTIGHTDTIVDTPDHALMNAGLVLRVRANERGTVLSLKSVSQKGSSEESRVRFCADVSLPNGTTKEDAIEILKKLLTVRGEDPLDPNPFVQGLEAAGIEVRKVRDLRPTLEVSSSRDRVRIQDRRDSSNVELSLDRSTITPYSKEGVLEPKRSITSYGFEYGLEHAGVNPTDQHDKKPSSSPKKVVEGFRGFHVPEDLSHRSLHDPESSRNRALHEIVGNVTGSIFGAKVKLETGGFKAIEGAEHLGLIDGSWREVVERRERTSSVGSGRLELRAPELPPHERVVANYVEEHGTLSIAQVKNLMRGKALGSLSIVAGAEERREIASWIHQNPWIVPYMDKAHLHEQLDAYGL